MILTMNEDQATTFEVIKDKRHYGIFFDMGVGKTALILKLIEYIEFDLLEECKTLIIAPATVANKLEVWQDEIQKWENFSYFGYYDLRGTQKKRMEKLKANFKKSSITIMSDGLVQWWAAQFGNLDMFDMIIIDESSRFKSNTAKKFKALSKMINLDKQRVYLLTGTPIPQGWHDIWSQIYLLDKGKRLGANYWKFLDNYFLVIKFRKILTKMGKKLIEDKIKDICVFASSDNIELPPKIEKKIYFEFSPKKKEKFKNFTRDYIMLLQDEATKNEKEITVLSKQILINKCLQLANGCIYHNKLGDYTVFDNTKLNYVKAYSEKYPEKNILVFYPFRFDKKRLLTLPGAVAIDSVKSKNDWNDGKIKLGIISPSSFQYGGNLQFGGYTLLWFGLVWGLENVLQSNKRLWRQGQTHPVEILYLMMRGTWDDYVYKTVVTKEVNQNDFLSRINIKNLT